MSLLLREADVQRLLTMSDALAAVESAFRDWAEGRADNQPRRRVKGGAVLAIMSAALPARGLIGFKAYTASSQGARFWVHLYDAQTGSPRALIEADHLGRLRTGAASGIATRLLSVPESSVLTLFGCGSQALAQVLAVATVRPIREVRVVGRNPERRRTFVSQLRQAWPAGEVIEASSARDAIEGSHVITTITSAATPLFPGSWLQPGQHLNVCGSNWPQRREVDAEAVSRAGTIVADDAQAARIEAGDLLLAEAEGRLSWTSVASLKEVVSGAVGRQGPADITLFKSVGLALEDLALAARLVERAEQEGPVERLAL